MADKLQLPFELGGTGLSPKVQADLQAIIDFINEVNTGLETLTALSVGSLTATGTVAGNALSSTTSVSGATVAATGAISGASASITNAVAAGSVAATGAVSAASAAITNAVSAGSVAATGAVSGASASITNAVSAGSVAATGAVSAASASITNAVAAGSAAITGAITGASADITNTVQGATIVADSSGSAASPAVSINGIGLYAVGSEQLGLATSDTKQVEIDSSGNIMQPNQPSFLARATGQSIAASGSATITYGTEIFDVGGDYNNGTYTFTAPVSGYYHLFFSAYVTTQPTATVPYLIKASIVTSNRTYIFQQPVVDTDGAGNGQMTVTASVLADMDANDTASVTLFVSEASNITNSELNVIGTPGSTVPVNFFMGTLIN